MGKSYFVGCLLSASRNPLNRIQFFAKQNSNGKVSLYARTRAFDSEPDTRKMDYVGMFSSMKSAVSQINESRDLMASRGLAVPGTKIHRLK